MSLRLQGEAATDLSGRDPFERGVEREQLRLVRNVKVAADEIVSVVHASLEGTAEITRSAESLHQLSQELRTATEAMRTRAKEASE